MEKKGIKIAAQNRKAFHDYFVEDRYEAGVELFGTDVKSIRAGTLNLKDSYNWLLSEVHFLFFRLWQTVLGHRLLPACSLLCSALTHLRMN